MRRRQFVELAVTTLAASVAGACVARSDTLSGSASPKASLRGAVGLGYSERLWGVTA
ncbi:MAG TPA: hypothetical protein VNO21_23185 [Polyangiaceae bacterium]|nr:hypothetical protein [Polyangiaceae bacterium]